MANPVARMMLLRSGKSFPLSLLRGSVSCASSRIKLESKLAVDERSQPQIPVSVQYFLGMDSALAANGFNTRILYSDTNRLEVAKSAPGDDDDYIDDDDDDDDDDGDFSDFGDFDDYDDDDEERD